MNINRLLSSIALALVLLFSSCEREKNGILDVTISPPFLVSASASHSTLDLDTTTSGAVTRLPNNTYRVSGAVSATVSDPFGWQDIRQVSYKIFRPKSPDVISSGSFVRSDSVYTASFSFTIERSDAGVYRIEVTALNTGNLVSNALQV